MNNEHRSNQGGPTGDRSTFGVPTTASAGQLARNRGNAWVRALTLGAGAAGLVGAAAIAATLPGSATAASVQIAPAASTSGTTSNGDSATSDGDSATSESSEDNGGSDDVTGSDDASEDSSRSEQQRQPAAPKRQRQQAAPRQQLQPAAPPANSNNPPAATSGAS